MNRRHFLVGTGAALTASAAPQKIRTGILGVQHSHLGPKLDAMRGNPAYDVVAVADPDPAMRQEIGGLKWTPVDEMIADPSLQLIVFEGEVKDAVPLGMRVIEAGKHLHLEKPPTNRMAPFVSLAGAARTRGLKLQLGYLWRFHAGADAAIEACRNGWLGEVFMIRATINADRDDKQRLKEARFSGGGMFELGGHMIDRIIALLGRPSSVKPWLRHDTSRPDRHNDNTLAVLEYSKTLAVVVSSAADAAGSYHRSFEVIGTDGSMMVQPMEPVPTLRVDMRRDAGPYRKGVQEIKLPPQPRFVRDFEELARGIQTGSPLKYSYDHEVLLQETLLRASGEAP